MEILMSDLLYEFVDENESEDMQNYEYFYEDVIVDKNPPAIAPQQPRWPPAPACG